MSAEDIHICGACRGEFHDLEEFVVHKKSGSCQSPAKASLSNQVTGAPVIVSSSEYSFSKKSGQLVKEQVVLPLQQQLQIKSMLEAQKGIDASGIDMSKVIVLNPGVNLSTFFNNKKLSASLDQSNYLLQTTSSAIQLPTSAKSFQSQNQALSEVVTSDSASSSTAQTFLTSSSYDQLNKLLQSYVPQETINKNDVRSTTKSNDQPQTMLLPVQAGFNAVAGHSNNSPLKQPLDGGGDVVHVVFDGGDPTADSAVTEAVNVTINVDEGGNISLVPAATPTAPYGSKTHSLVTSLTDSLTDQQTGNVAKPTSSKTPKKESSGQLTKMYMCSWEGCTFKTAYRKDLARHTRIHSGEKPFSCNLCDKKFSRSDKLNIHVRSHTGDKPYQCQTCNYTTSDGSSLRKHIRIHTQERPFKCQMCSYTAKNSSQLTVHLRIHTGDTPFQCHICQAKFKIHSDLNRHLRMHSGEKPFECPHCSYRCSVKSNLKSHLSLVHNPDNMKQCKMCDFQTSSKRQLNEHEKTHLPAKNYKCDKCSYSCNAAQAMKIHSFVHTNDKPYHCPYCTYSSNQGGNVRAHLRRKHPNKPVPVKKHRKLARPAGGSAEKAPVPLYRQRVSKALKPVCQKTFKCDECDEAFVREDSLRSHKRFHQNPQYIQRREAAAVEVLSQAAFLQASIDEMSGQRNDMVTEEEIEEELAKRERQMRERMLPAAPPALSLEEQPGAGAGEQVSREEAGQILVQAMEQANLQVVGEIHEASDDCDLLPSDSPAASHSAVAASCSSDPSLRKFPRRQTHGQSLTQAASNLLALMENSQNLAVEENMQNIARQREMSRQQHGSAQPRSHEAASGASSTSRMFTLGEEHSYHQVLPITDQPGMSSEHLPQHLQQHEQQLQFDLQQQFQQSQQQNQQQTGSNSRPKRTIKRKINKDEIHYLGKKGSFQQQLYASSNEWNEGQNQRDLNMYDGLEQYNIKGEDG